MNLIVGKNSFISTALSNWLSGTYISYKELDTIDCSQFDTLYLLSFPNEYKFKIENEFKFEKKLFKAFKYKKIFIFSTSKIYPFYKNCDELILPEPSSYYAQNKLSIENLVTQYTEKYFILRISNVFSNNRWSKDTFFDILSKNYENDKIIKFDVSLESVRDFITINSLEDILKKLSLSNKFGTYNVGSQKGLKIDKVLSLFFKKNDFNKISKFQTNAIKSQTLNIKKLSDVINISNNTIHADVINELENI